MDKPVAVIEVEAVHAELVVVEDAVEEQHELLVEAYSGSGLEIDMISMSP